MNECVKNDNQTYLSRKLQNENWFWEFPVDDLSFNVDVIIVFAFV